jgi:hypothetical protein
MNEKTQKGFTVLGHLKREADASLLQSITELLDAHSCVGELSSIEIPECKNGMCGTEDCHTYAWQMDVPLDTAIGRRRGTRRSKTASAAGSSATPATPVLVLHYWRAIITGNPTHSRQSSMPDLLFTASGTVQLHTDSPYAELLPGILGDSKYAGMWMTPPEIRRNPGDQKVTPRKNNQSSIITRSRSLTEATASPRNNTPPGKPVTPSRAPHKSGPVLKKSRRKIPICGQVTVHNLGTGSTINWYSDFPKAKRDVSHMLELMGYQHTTGRCFEKCQLPMVCKAATR